jgi:cobalt-zinc-cadmium efflux system protein
MSDRFPSSQDHDRCDGGYSHGGGSSAGHHHHHHPPASHDTAFAVGAILNAGFVVAEVGFGLGVNSVALLADAAHNLGDVLGLLLAWGAAWLGRRPPSPRRTYGWGRSSILAALVNATVLLVGVGAITVEAIRRLFQPEPVGEMTVVIVAATGVVVNGVTAWLFMRGREHDLNIRGAFLHMAGDAAVSVGVVVAALLIGLTGWLWLDPVASLLIAAMIVASTWSLLRDAVNLAMDAVPGGIEHDKVHAYLLTLPGVVEVHDLHIWGLSTTDTALTAHLVCAREQAGTALLDRAAAGLQRRFGIGHSTFQLEDDADAELCRLRPHDVV